jgi:hypothetical protein
MGTMLDLLAMRDIFGGLWPAHLVTGGETADFVCLELEDPPADGPDLLLGEGWSHMSESGALNMPAEAFGMAAGVDRGPRMEVFDLETEVVGPPS